MRQGLLVGVVRSLWMGLGLAFIIALLIYEFGIASSETPLRLVAVGFITGLQQMFGSFRRTQKGRSATLLTNIFLTLLVVSAACAATFPSPIRGFFVYMPALILLSGAFPVSQYKFGDASEEVFEMTVPQPLKPIEWALSDSASVLRMTFDYATEQDRLLYELPRYPDNRSTLKRWILVGSAIILFGFGFDIIFGGSVFEIVRSEVRYTDFILIVGFAFVIRYLAVPASYVIAAAAVRYQVALASEVFQPFDSRRVTREVVLAVPSVPIYVSAMALIIV